MFVYKGIEGRSRGYFGSVSVCKSTICRKLKEANETVAHERPQTRAQSMENHERMGELRQTIVILEKERDLGKEREFKKYF